MHIWWLKVKFHHHVMKIKVLIWTLNIVPTVNKQEVVLQYSDSILLEL